MDINLERTSTRVKLSEWLRCELPTSPTDSKTYHNLVERVRDRCLTNTLQQRRCGEALGRAGTIYHQVNPDPNLELLMNNTRSIVPKFCLEDAKYHGLCFLLHAFILSCILVWLTWLLDIIKSIASLSISQSDHRELVIFKRYRA